MEPADLQEARRVLKKDIWRAVEWAIAERGFTLRKQGHAYALYCPCDPVTAEEGNNRLPFVRVDGSPKNPTWTAKKIRQAVSRCPDQHQLMRVQ